jgi:hypothetical protein
MAIVEQIFFAIVTMILIMTNFTASPDFHDNVQMTFNGTAILENESSEKFQIVLSYSGKKLKIEKLSKENPTDDFLILMDDQEKTETAYFKKLEMPYAVEKGEMTAEFFKDKDQFLNKPEIIQKELKKAGKLIKSEKVNGFDSELWEIDWIDKSMLKLWYSNEKQFFQKLQSFRYNQLEYTIETAEIKTGMKFPDNFFDIKTYAKDYVEKIPKKD